MKKPSSSGKCNLCGGEFGKAAMGRHLAGCQQPNISSATPANDQSPGFHLLVEGFPNIYWLHVAAPTNAPLSKLDKGIPRMRRGNAVAGSQLTPCGCMWILRVASVLA